MRRRALNWCWALLAVALLAACGKRPAPTSHEYPLTGEIVAITSDGGRVTIKHEDIPGFMPAMTMPFNVKQGVSVAGLAVGDRVDATLVVTDDDSYLSTIRKIGTVPPQERAEPPPVPNQTLQPGSPMPNITFTDEQGKPMALGSYKGSAVLLTFIYTRCPLPDFCPRMDAYFARLQEAIKARPQLKGHVQLVSISFDPDFDTPSQLESHARGVDADPAIWRFVTAPRDTVDAFGRRIGLTVIREGPDGSNISHNLRTALVDAQGKLVKVYDGNDWSVDDVLDDLQDLIH